MVNTLQAGPQAKTASMRRSRKIIFSAIAVALTIVVSGFMLWPATPQDLALDNQMQQSGLYEHWRAGQVIVLVRHSERCDRSANPCLGPADGITQLGSVTASELGQAFRTLGMEHTDVLSSPMTRTLQTTQSMFNQAPRTQEWLVTCGKNLERDIKAHKLQGRNLILVTHSGCISDLESHLGFAHALASEYTSSLFVTLTADGEMQVVGIMNARNWPQVLKEMPNNL
ncbi:histidine phosphatase family protein [Pseudomonas sp. Fl5BN2]|uniref:lipopolysaccharide core heptose(II)-phosphate phosphatase PmrG n=1 Tax=Pseudomonas sp. Fl5BN2 TaxID=2697652 RepID=UPI0034CFC447